MQIVSGFLTVGGDDGTVRENISFRENPRAEALSELLTEITPHSKVLIWAVFKENYEAIRNVCNSLGVDFVEVHGDVPEKKKQENVKAFNEDPKVRVFIGHPASGGIGINLCSASYSIFYSRNFSLEQDLQAEARNYRGGSEVHEKIIRINLIAKDTIDEVVTEALGGKVKIGDDILKKIALEGK
jgi:ATP-dependent DNA helicase